MRRKGRWESWGVDFQNTKRDWCGSHFLYTGHLKVYENHISADRGNQEEAQPTSNSRCTSSIFTAKYKIFHLFSSMCTYSSQYVTKLCKSGILNIIRTHLDKENTRIQEIATILLGDVVKLYASPSKAYTKGDKFDMTVRASVMSHDFISRLVRMIVKPDQSVQLQKACFWCLSQYNNEIQFSEDDCIQVLATINILLNGTVLLFLLTSPNHLGWWRLTDQHLQRHHAALRSTNNRHRIPFFFSTFPQYLIASCVIPNIIELLAYPSIQVVSCSLRVVGYVVALDRNEKENIDYTEVPIPKRLHF